MEDDREKVMLEGRWQVRGQFLVANWWSLGQLLKIQVVARFLSRLSFTVYQQLWNHKILMVIAKVIGDMFMDADLFIDILIRNISPYQGAFLSRCMIYCSYILAHQMFFQRKKGMQLVYA